MQVFAFEHMVANAKMSAIIAEYSVGFLVLPMMSVEAAEDTRLTVLSATFKESVTDVAINDSQECVDAIHHSSEEQSVDFTDKSVSSNSLGANDKQPSSSEEKSQSKENSQQNNNDSKDKPKGPKTFDKETFVEAPIPKTNPWKKNISPNPIPPSEKLKENDSKSPEGEDKHDDNDEDKTFTVVASHRNSARSPRSSKHIPRHYGPAHRNDFKPVYNDRTKFKKAATTKPHPVNPKQPVNNTTGNGRTGSCVTMSYWAISMLQCMLIIVYSDSCSSLVDRFALC